MITMQHNDLFEDSKQPSYTPSSVIDHRITKTIVKEASSPEHSPQLNKQRQIHTQVISTTVETSWINTTALKLRDPQIIVDYTLTKGLT